MPVGRRKMTGKRQLNLTDGKSFMVDNQCYKEHK
jgi:hypothetical protein